MATTFACPDCGGRIQLSGRTPGRQVVCPSCTTRVEVPYLPRVAKVTRVVRVERPALRRSGRWGRSTAQRRTRWALALGSVALVALGTTWVVGRVAARARSERERVVEALVAASEQAERNHDPAGAFREMEAAWIRARQVEPPESARLLHLRERRDRLARAEVEARLTALPGLEADRGAGEALILAERAQRDPALAPLAEAIASGVEVALRRQIESDHDRSRADLQARRGIVAFERAARAHRRADGLRDRVLADCLRVQAQHLLAEAVGRFGVITRPDPLPPGETPPPTAPGDDFAGSLWLDALAAHGYLIEPAGSDWGELWATRAPYHAAAVVAETAEELYQQSQNRATKIEARFSLTERGRPSWDYRIFAQTRSPILDLPAFLAGKLATAAHRDAEIERRLRDDARNAFRTQAERIFRGIPAADAGPIPPAPPATPVVPPPAPTGGSPGSGERST